MKVQEVKSVVEKLGSELKLIESNARKAEPSAEDLLDRSQFIVFEIVRVTAEFDAVAALLNEDLAAKRDVASPELVIALNEVVTEVAGLKVRLEGNPGVSVKTSPAGAPDYRAAVEAIASTRNLT